jgi:NAD+ synthase
MIKKKQFDEVNSHIVTWLKTYAENAKVNGFVVEFGGVDSAVTSTLCAQTGLSIMC